VATASAFSKCGFGQKFKLRSMEIRPLDVAGFLVCWSMEIRVSGGCLNRQKPSATVASGDYQCVYTGMGLAESLRLDLLAALSPCN